MRAHGFERVEAGLFDDARDVLNAGLAMNRFVIRAHRHCRAFGGGRMGVEHDGVPCGNDVDDVATKCRD